MSGGGGGSSKKKKDEDKGPTGPTFPAATFQPTLPGFNNAIADQLASGFGLQTGMGANDFMGMLNSMYQPMTLDQLILKGVEQDKKKKD